MTSASGDPGDGSVDRGRGSVDRGRGGSVDLRWAWAATAAVARHPSLWRVAARQVFVLAAPGWWRRRPFLPLPSPDYLRFRLQTAYGGAGDRLPEPGDLVTYLRWCRDIG
jgi:hypothetical protein